MTTTTTSDLARAAKLFHALSDETRLGILEMLRAGEHCVCDLQSSFDAAQSRLSYHLKVLKAAGLVTDRQEGRWSYYSMVPNALTEPHDIIRMLATEELPVAASLAAGSLAAGSLADASAVRSRSVKALRVLGSCCE